MLSFSADLESVDAGEEPSDFDSLFESFDELAGWVALLDDLESVT